MCKIEIEQHNYEKPICRMFLLRPISRQEITVARSQLRQLQAIFLS
jgi:hypothetical protein